MLQDRYKGTLIEEFYQMQNYCLFQFQFFVFQFLLLQIINLSQIFKRMGNIIRQYPKSSQAKEKCKYISKYTFFFILQALFLFAGVSLVIPQEQASCKNANPSTCGCSALTFIGTGVPSSSCPLGTLFSNACYANNQYYCCDSCFQSLGVCIVCSGQVTMISTLWIGIGFLLGELIMIGLTVWLIKRRPKPVKTKKNNQQELMLTIKN